MARAMFGCGMHFLEVYKALCIIHIRTARACCDRSKDSVWSMCNIWFFSPILKGKQIGLADEAEAPCPVLSKNSTTSTIPTKSVLELTSEILCHLCHDLLRFRG